MSELFGSTEKKADPAAAQKLALRDALWDADLVLTRARGNADARAGLEALADAVREFLDPRP